MLKTLSIKIKNRAGELGFGLSGITSVNPPDNAGLLDEWLARGYAGEMAYLSRNRDVRKDLSIRFPWAKSLVCVGAFYMDTRPTEGIAGSIARYAQGDDYHVSMMEPLKKLEQYINESAGRESISDVRTHRYIDTGPVMERQYASRAGLGWIGKNGIVINESLGSYFFLGEIITSIELPADTPAVDRCGTCTRCLDACPTSAFPAPYVLDATKCISYLTIESKNPVPDETKDKLSGNLFGCDICQEVCPWQDKRTNAERKGKQVYVQDVFFTRPEYLETSIDDIRNMTDDKFNEIFKGTPVKRPGAEKVREVAQDIS